MIDDFNKKAMMADIIICALAQRPNQQLKARSLLALVNDTLGMERMVEIATMSQWRNVVIHIKEGRFLKIDHSGKQRTYCYTVKTLRQREKEVIARRTMLLPHKDDTVSVPPDI